MNQTQLGYIGSDGIPVSPDSLTQTLNYTSGNLTSVVATDGTNTWTQTLGYDGSNNLTSVSKWVRS
jgi:YD repeat-containing protein